MMVLNFKPLIGLTTLLLSSQMAAAGVKFNAMCFLAPKSEKAQGFAPTQKEIAESGSPLLSQHKPQTSDKAVQTAFRIASLSKLYTSHWALHRLGPEYRFDTRIYVTPGTTAEGCNIHFEGDMDPVMGRDSLNRIVKELQPVFAKHSCTQVQTISFDENFRALLPVMDHQKSSSALSLYGWSNPSQYESSSRTLRELTQFLRTQRKPQFKLDKIGPIQKKNYQAYLNTVPYEVYSYKSQPLSQILRELNKYSHNYMPNIIFTKLGGAPAFKSFIQERLGLPENSTTLLNGSGYPIVNDDESKIYNTASCESLVMMLKDTDLYFKNLKSPKKFQVADIMPVGGPEESYSTFKSLYASSTFDKTLAAKTGSAEKAITFSGVISTQEGNLYFGALTSPDAYIGRDLSQARELIRDSVVLLIERFKLKPFQYEIEAPFQVVPSNAQLTAIATVKESFAKLTTLSTESNQKP